MQLMNFDFLRFLEAVQSSTADPRVIPRMHLSFRRRSPESLKKDACISANAQPSESTSISTLRSAARGTANRFIRRRSKRREWNACSVEPAGMPRVGPRGLQGIVALIGGTAHLAGQASLRDPPASMGFWVHQPTDFPRRVWAHTFPVLRAHCDDLQRSTV